MKYRESEEMYLETILLLKQTQKTVRSIDIANNLGYSRASVSRAISLLKQRNYIVINNSLIEFTDEGFKRANEIYERHSVITEVLQKIGVPEILAEDNACRIEHVVTPELLEYFKKFINVK